MRTMGFAKRWIHLIMTCVSTVSYSVLINGTPYGYIHPTRGIRQGDPFSPYLFLLVAEGLSSLIVQVENEGKITGVPISIGGARLSHLFFAIDSLLFSRANFDEWCNLQKVLKTYEFASGQKLNAEKTSIFFSLNTGSVFKTFIRSFMGIGIFSSYEKYLGLPALVVQSKMKTFEGIQHRVQKKMDGWKEKFLSQAGKEILLKAVVQAIPTYSMSVFQLPKILCSSVNKMMSRFWWGGAADKKSVAWMSWEKLGGSKLKGGMGFRDLEIFN